MAKYNTLKNYIVLFLAISVIWSLWGCASPKAVEGGPRDSIPPKIISMLPKNLSTNFTSKKIIITFDEFFKLNDQFKEFSVTPDLERQPVLKVKKKTLEIDLDSLEKNTTYTLNFGKAIADINEGNALKNFTYVFSTGKYLDSLSISGKVVNSITGLPELDALGFIIPISRDSIFGKRKPSIYATTDSSGNFKLNNLRKDTYRIYALKEKNSDKIYQQASDEIAFLKDSVVLTENTSNVLLKLFKEDATVFRIIDRKLNNDGSIFMALNQKLRKPSITILNPANLDATKKVKFNLTNDSVKVWLTSLSFDSVFVSVLEQGKLLQTAKFTKGKKDVYTRNVTATDNIEGELLNPNKTLKLTFPLPMESADVSKIVLTEDSVAKTNFTVTKDSLDFLSYEIKYPWSLKKKYEIKFGPGAFTAIFNAKNKEFTKKFELANADDYGTLKLKIITPELSKSYGIEVINEGKNIVNRLTITKDTTVTFSKYRAGKYFLRVVYDTNKNGIWDTGSVLKRLQPEEIYNEPKELSVRAGWDRNETITIPKQK
jgi:DNA-directed RNA polymerase subunit L